MRRSTACLSLVFAILAAGCGGGGAEADLEKSGDELRKDAAGMSREELERKIDELEEYGKGLEKAGGDPTRTDIQKAAKLIEAMSIYQAELMKKRAK